MPFVPSEDVNWTLTPVYNNKRKVTEDEQMTLEVENPQKRLCQESLNIDHTMDSEENHNLLAFPNQNNNNNNSIFCSSADLDHQDVYGCMKDVVPISNGELIHHNTPVSLPSSQNEMIMDLSDETYTNTTLERDSYIESMDNDYVPDSQQYITPKKSDPNCNNCVGERSPSASAVRCFCKPTWDNLMDLRPYISDYY